MPDWTAYVRDRLPLDRVAPERTERIVRELAGQLADFHAEALSRGLSDADAQAYVTAQVPDWRRFADDLIRAEAPHAPSTVDRLVDRFDARTPEAATEE